MQITYGLQDDSAKINLPDWQFYLLQVPREGEMSSPGHDMINGVQHIFSCDRQYDQVEIQLVWVF